MKATLRIQRLAHASNLDLPKYETSGSSGMDIRAALSEPLCIAAGEICLVPTGLKVAVPRGYEIQIRPRSGLALRHGISLPNTPATIDSDYRGELKIIVINHGKEDFVVRHGDRIAQMVVTPVVVAQVEEVNDLEQTQRGSGGFGSTGRA